MLKWKVNSGNNSNNNGNNGGNNNYSKQDSNDLLLNDHSECRKTKELNGTSVNITSDEQSDGLPSNSLKCDSAEVNDLDEDPSNFGGDYPSIRSEIANFEDVLTTIRNSVIFNDEDDSIITLKSSNLSSCCDDSAFFESDSPPTSQVKDFNTDSYSSTRSKTGYVADDSDLSSTIESIRVGEKCKLRTKYQPKCYNLECRVKNNERLWDEIALSDTDVEDELRKDIDCCIGTSVDDTCSLSGSSLKSSDWEWKPQHTLKEFCKTCKMEEAEKNKIFTEVVITSESSSIRDNIIKSDVEIKEISKEPLNSKDKRQTIDNDHYKIAPVPIPYPRTKKQEVKYKSTTHLNNSETVLKIFDDCETKSVQEDREYDDIFPNFNTLQDKKHRHSLLSEINFNYGVRLNKFTFSPKVNKSCKDKDQKEEKRRSHFFVDDLHNNLSDSKSWLDENYCNENSTMTECKAKLNRLFRSKSFSFSKMDIFSSCEPKPPKVQTKNYTHQESEVKKKVKVFPKIHFPKGISKSLPKPRNSQNRPSVLEVFRSKVKSVDIVDGAFTNLFPEENMTAIHLAAESRDYLMWCPDAEFDKAVASLDMRGLVDLIHTLQDSMAVEQQTFESLSVQLEQVKDSILQQRMSAALCTSQSRLARLCARNMRCFTQQALKSRQRDQSPARNTLDSRVSSPGDSGVAFSTSGSDHEGDLKGTLSLPPMSPSSAGGNTHNTHGFRNSLSFFQKAANIVTNNTRTITSAGHRQKDQEKNSKRYPEKSWRETVPNSGLIKDPGGCSVGSSPMEGVTPPEGCRREVEGDDNETYEQVLYINGRPQFQGETAERSRSYDALLDSNVPKHSTLEKTSIAINTEPEMWNTESKRNKSSHIEIKNDFQQDRFTSKDDSPSSQSVGSGPSQRLDAFGNSLHSRSLGDITCVTLPRRKPVLNFGSVSDESSQNRGLLDPNGDSSVANSSDYYDKTAVSVGGGGDNGSETRTLIRAHSFKEGLDSTYDTPRPLPLIRAQSLYDGLDTGSDDSVNTPKINNAPSVDEILESVKSLRVQKISMVKSSPELLLQPPQEKAYSSSSSSSNSRHKTAKSSSKGSKKNSNGSGGSNSGSSSSRKSSSSSHDAKYDKTSCRSGSTRLHYDTDSSYYENIGRSECQYENLPAAQVDVIYDEPKSTKVMKVDKGVGGKTDRRKEQHRQQIEYYENLDFDPVYENVEDDLEPTYMNVDDDISESNFYQGRNSIYANIEEEQNRHKKSSNRRHNKAGLIPLNYFDEEFTYDVPKSVTPIYDTPPKQTRKVVVMNPNSQPPKNNNNNNNIELENEYDTPQNNRSVYPQQKTSKTSKLSNFSIRSKTDQMKRIEDIFADVDVDSLDGDPDRDLDGELDRDLVDIPHDDSLRRTHSGYNSEEDNYCTIRRSKSDATSDYIDEGLGESDSRSYYADEQGLEVILEEPEDDYCSSHSSAEDLRRRLDHRLRLKGERRSLGSLEGSEGIGSAEGEEGDDSRSSSSGSSEAGVEEYCSSSGIHSEDTPSPAPSADKAVGSPAPSPDEVDSKKEEERIQKDRCIEVYPETIRQRQRNMTPSPSKVDIKNWEPAPEDGKKFLPSVKALRNQFENGKTKSENTLVRTSSDSSSANSLVLNSLDTSSGFGSLTSSQLEPNFEVPRSSPREHDEEPVEPIFSQFREVDEEFKEMMSKPPSTQGWNPQPLLKKLYYVPDAPKIHRREVPYVNIEGYLEKLPSGRKKATFWNAWKRRYFVAKDGVLYYYQSNQAEKPNMKLPLIGGKIEIMDPTMISVEDGGRESRSAGMLGIDDGKGHYVVVRCPTRQEAERWKEALESHTYDDFASHYVQPWPRPTNPTLLRDTLVIDIGSCSVRAGVLASQPTLPQLFFPSVVATNRETKAQIWGIEALMPDIRPTSFISFPIRPSHKISKFSVDLNAVSSLLQKTFNDLKVDPKNYNIQLSVPRVLNPHTQAELLKILFDRFGVKSVNMTHQSILALYAYNATSGIIVDIGERLDVVPVIDGYIVDGGVSRVPYGGYRITDHLRQFLFQKNISLINEVDSYIIRLILESICYCAEHYNTEKQRCTMNPENFEKLAPLSEFFSEDPRFDTFRNLSLDFARFQATEGLFNPDAWGLDHPGLHKLVHKAIQECSMDIRKELSRSIFLVGGVSQLPGVADRLTVEIDNLTPPAIRPKVHASPYRYHASFLGACILAESDAFAQSKITKEEWTKQGNSALRKWAL